VVVNPEWWAEYVGKDNLPIHDDLRRSRMQMRIEDGDAHTHREGMEFQVRGLPSSD